jgi:AcrR family transcriptional regulator
VGDAGTVGAVAALPRGRHRLTREQVSASQRGRLLVAMADVVARKGFAHTAVADVAAHAGVSTKTFYEHFTGKEDCFLAAHAACVDALIGIMRSALGTRRRTRSGSSGGESRFSRMLRAYLDTLAAEPALARTFLIEVYAAGPRALERRAAAQRGFAALLAESFGRPGRPAFECEALVGTISSLVTAKVSLGAYDELADLHAPIVEFVERQLGQAERVPA